MGAGGRADGAPHVARTALAGGGAATDQQPETSAQNEPIVQYRSEGDDGLSPWQAAEIGLGLLLAALVVVLVVLQRLANRARRLDPGF